MAQATSPRSDAELLAIVQALRTGGADAPRWLRAELAPRFSIPRAEADPNAYRGHMAAALSAGALLLAFMGCVDFAGDVAFAPAKAASREAALDDDALVAIAMVQDWLPAGDDKPVLARLAAVARNPAYPRAWSAEKREDDSYLVIFREPVGPHAYAFEVDLESEAVEPTPEAVERLTMLRVREESVQTSVLVARQP